MEEAARLFARFSRYPDYTLYVADCDGRIVGSFALLVMDNLGHCGAPSAVVEDVVVAAQAQGKGIGKAMMAFARERCRADAVDAAQRHGVRQKLGQRLVERDGEDFIFRS